MNFNTTIRSSIRASSQAAQRLSASRGYASSRPPMSHGGYNRNIIIALVGVSLPALYIYNARSEAGMTTPLPDNHPKAAEPRSDPGARSKAAKENLAENGRKNTHPEHREPEKYKPAFGQLHQNKRVDGPPDGRNHQALNDRNAQI